ncbi:dipeptidase PepE [Paraflavisolibacter sp. H34]|uniref:dipeptidase PepE n=1 Tax=Huijunlia imazamoxiresistens TaxID=3127457 RepID=UPI0030164DE8
MMEILALSSSRAGNGAYLETAAPLVEEVLGATDGPVAFIPFAAADREYTRYADRVREALPSLAARIQVVSENEAEGALQQAAAILVGGGNTFKLLHDLYRLQLLDAIRQKVAQGCPYIGWSAGANLAGRSIATTNDMPIIQPPSFTSLGFFPFQINPHYLNLKTEGFHGETRDMRLEEFLLLNPGIPVVGLPEGTALRLQHGRLWYAGGVCAALFQSGAAAKPLRRDILPGEDLSFLLL